MEIPANRRGGNVFPKISEKPFEYSVGCTGVSVSSHLKDGDPVMKIGKQIGATVAVYNEQHEVFFHKEMEGHILTRTISADPMSGGICRKGDSGSFVFCEEGGVVGLLVGGCVAKADLNSLDFYHSIYIPIEEVLKSAEEEYGEVFYVPNYKEGM